MNPISQVMCVTGPCFDEAPSWTAETRRKVAGVPKLIAASVKRFLAGEVAKTPALPALDYWSMLTSMTTLPEHDDANEILKALGHDLGPKFVIEQHRIHDIVRKAFPVAVVKRPAGPVNVEPTPVKWFRFRRLNDIALHPLVVLDCLESRYVTSDHARLLQQLYPDVYADICNALMSGVQAAAARKKSWELPYKSDLALQAFLQMSAISPKLAEKMQNGFKAQPQPAQGPAGQGPADRVTTPTQRATNL